MDDVIKLVNISYTKDNSGNLVPSRSTRQVFCKVNSIGRSEFYQAAQVDMKPSYTFIRSHFMDYQGERELLYTDWTGVEKNYVILRTYRGQNDKLEIVAEERKGRDGSVSGSPVESNP